VVGFLAPALLILRVRLPPQRMARQRPFLDRLTRGGRFYLAEPRLRGLSALNMAVAAVIAFVLVDTVVLVRAGFGGRESDMALVLPRLLRRVPDRAVMLAGGAWVGPWADDACGGPGRGVRCWWSGPGWGR